VEQLRLVLGALQMATVTAQVGLSIFTDFEGFTAFKPAALHEQAVHRMLDQVVAWSRALRPLRAPDHIAIAREYFTRFDQGRADVLDLFHEDAELYFPKFGIRVGRESLVELANGFAGSLDFIRHDHASLSFIASGDHVVVEGTSQGRLAGKDWAGGQTPGGRFCDVFRFRDGRIASVHVYLDPDYTGEDEARFRWGKHRTW
jgi:ketosteroid isomerase-like protein